MTPQYLSEITVSRIEGMQMGSDLMIAAAAWASTSTASALERARLNPSDVEGVIHYLVKHRHGTPFEHGGITHYVHAPIFVWREWHRHRIGFSYNEESARYHQLEPVYFIPRKDRPMFKADNWKAGRPKFLTIEQFDAQKLSGGGSGEWRYNQLCQNLRESYDLSYINYVKNLALDIDPGLARDCLPVGIYSSCWVTANPRSLMSFLSLRVFDPTALFVSYPLHEINDAANQIELSIKEFWPITWEAFSKNRRVAP